VFYSDGITETFNSKEEMFGLERLMELITANGDDSAHTLAQRILTEVDSFANGAPLVDDLTLVVLKVLPRIVSFKYEIDLERFDDVVHFIRRKIDAYGVDFAYQVELAASEVITNIVKYAYQGRAGELRGEITLQENDVILDLYDDGNRFDPSKLTEIDLEQAHIGGYGMHIVHQIMDKVDYSPGGEKGSNHWRMVKRLTGDKKP
jgi:anti-sigma regulatory factor (Ser/Thr protein kinase)